MSTKREAWTHKYRVKIPLDTPRAKYQAIAIHVDGHRFASKREAARYSELKLMLGAGMITELQLHPAFPLQVVDLSREGPPWTIHHVGLYTADFRYRDPTGQWVVEDVKSKPTRTEAYQLRKKIVEAIHGITIVEIE